MEGQVPSLETIGERNPSKVSNGEHEAETVGGDVHGCEESGFIVESVCDIPELEGEDEPHGIRDFIETTTTDSLFAGHADIDENPENETWAQFIERLDVE